MSSSQPSLQRSSTAPFKLTGNSNTSRDRCFSTFAYESEPMPIIPPIPRTSPVNPFTISTLPSSPSTLYYQPNLTSSQSVPPSHPTPPYHHHGITTLRSRTFPSHSPSAPPQALSLSYTRDLHWMNEPHVEPSMVELYRTMRRGGEAKVWRGNNVTGGLFRDERGGWEEVKERKAGKKERTGRVQHAEGWRGAGSGREGSDRGQLHGKVEPYHLSPFERTEAVRSKLVAESMRQGYRVTCDHKLHAGMKLGRGVGRSEGRFHSRRSEAGVCRHNCQGVE